MPAVVVGLVLGDMVHGLVVAKACSPDRKSERVICSRAETD